MPSDIQWGRYYADAERPADGMLWPESNAHASTLRLFW
jgi:hypothetical protein